MSESNGVRRLHEIAGRTMTSGGLTPAADWETHIDGLHWIAQRDAIECVDHIATLAAENKRLQGEIIVRDESTIVDIGNVRTCEDSHYVYTPAAVRQFMQHARADALREVREGVGALPSYWSEADDGYMSDKDGTLVSLGGAFLQRGKVLALLGAPRGEGEG